jgi:hypothetical protein
VIRIVGGRGAGERSDTICRACSTRCCAAGQRAANRQRQNASRRNPSHAGQTFEHGYSVPDSGGRCARSSSRGHVLSF